MLRKIMRQHGDRIGDLADYLGIHRNSMQRKISGKGPFTAWEAMEICRRYQLTMEQAQEVFGKKVRARYAHITLSLNMHEILKK